jgi:hypothetical protein
LLAVLFAFPSLPVHAASVSVSVTIKVTVAETGAPSFIWTITGCLAVGSPSSGTSGTPQNVTLSPSCTYVISSGGATGNGTLRDRLTSSYATSISETSCPLPGPCTAVSLTAHVQELLVIGSNCNTPAVSVASPTSDSWYNYGTSLTVSCSGVWGRSGGTGFRATSWNWDGGTNTAVATTGLFSSPQIMNSHHTFNVNRGTQYQLTLDAGATRALASVTSPTITSDYYWYDSGTAVTYTGNGVFARANGFGNRSASWNLDSGTPTRLSTATGFSVSATMSSPHTIHVTTVSQWQVSLDSVSTAFTRSITTPTVTNDKYWYDAGTLVTLTLNGTGSRSGGVGTRLVSYAINGGTKVTVSTTGTVTVLNSAPIAGKESVTAVSATQYQLVLDSGASLALASVTSPPIPGDGYWYDSGTQVTYTGNGVFARASGTGLRAANWWWDSAAHTSILTTGTFSATATMSSSHTFHIQTMAQYEVTLTGAYGVSSATAPTISGDDYWYDAGTVVSMSLQGEFGRTAGSGWRMVSFSVNGGTAVPTAVGGAVTALSSVTLTSPQTISIQAVKQYQVSFDQAIAASLDSITGPTVAGDNYWYDSGSSVTITVHGVWGRTSTEGYRLSSYSINGGGGTPVASSGTVAVLKLTAILAPQSVTSTATIQYFLAVSGGSGSKYSVLPPIAGDSGWYDSGTSLRISTNGTYDTIGGARQRIVSWSEDGGQSSAVGSIPVVVTSTIVMNGPHSVSFNSITQYLVTIVVKDNNGADTLTPDSILLGVNGGTRTASSGAAWVDSASNVSVVAIMWHGLDVAPVQHVQYGVSSAFTITVNARVYDLTIFVRDPLGFAVGGADGKITLANGTTIHASSGGDGAINVRMIPLGTYEATISAFGLSSTLSGDASVQGAPVAQLPLGWSLILVVAAVVVIAVVGIILIRSLARARSQSPWGQSPKKRGAWQS